MPSQKIETGHQDLVHDVAMDYYGKRLATASSDATIKIMSVPPSSASGSAQSQQNQPPLATLTGHSGPVWQVAWAHPKFGPYLASCGYDGKVIVWREGASAHNPNEARSLPRLWLIRWEHLHLHCPADGSGWDSARIDQAHPVGVTSVSWAPSTAPGSLVGGAVGAAPVQKLASGGCDSTVKVWRLENGAWKLDCFPPLQKHTEWVRDVAWAPNLGLPKSTIASASQDGTVVIWTAGVKDGDQWEGRVLMDFKTPVWRVSWSLTGNILAVADGNNKVTLWKEAVDGEWQQVTTVEP
ncbi:hypothetical protein QJS10_CPB17g01155 [Acorus calamus]|uniref:Uncharacterized protein n=1 Tax=Acorus calamus TaxID=4465 RepID=A0AAV9CU95_ACOCL|nr:hypothetical protein QJS10_CPB17g01155 [Acorus calamus]